MNNSSTDQSFRFEGWHMLVIMVTFFAIIAMVNVTMAILANSNWTGLVVKNSYVASQEYNEILLDAEALRESGLHSDLSYSDGLMTFTLKDKNDAILAVNNLTASIGRPAHEHSDKILTFETPANVEHVLPVQLEPGVWAVSLTGIVDGVVYRRDERIFVDSEGKGTIE